MPVSDNMDWLCERTIELLHKDFRGHKAEIHARQLIKFTERVANAYGVNEAQLLDALIRRNFLEAVGSDTYEIHYDKVRK